MSTRNLLPLLALASLAISLSACETLQTDAAKVDFGADKQATVRAENRDARAAPIIVPKNNSEVFDALARDIAAARKKDKALDDDYAHIGAVQEGFGK